MKVRLYGHFIHYLPSETVDMECDKCLLDKLLEDLKKTDFLVDNIKEVE